VLFNGSELTAEQVAQVEAVMGSAVPAGGYWYDRRSGLWGLAFGPAVGFLPPHLPIACSLPHGIHPLIHPCMRMQALMATSTDGNKH
jgi:hypothetical protein